MQCAFMVQNKDNAIQRHRDMCMAMLTKQIKSTKRLVELKMKMSERMGVGNLEPLSLMVIKPLMLEQLDTDL
jgi:hypothetical protein